MTPEELANYRNAKIIKESDEAAARKAAGSAHLAEVNAKRTEADKLFREVALPYLAEVKKAMSPSFSFTPSTSSKDDQIVGINLQLDGDSALIQMAGGSITSMIRDRRHGGMNPFSAIKGVGDLTEENLSKLIQVLIDMD